MLAAGQDVFQYTGSEQTWTIPAGVHSASIVLVGGLGGADDSGFTYNAPAAQVTGTVTWPSVTGSLGIWVGGNGGNATSKASPGAGGFNGGAAGGTGSEESSAGGGGGGATDIRIGGSLVANRVLVAGGSGGDGGTYSVSTPPRFGGGGGYGGAGTSVLGVWAGGGGAAGSGDGAGSGGAGGQFSNGQGDPGGNAEAATGNGGGGGGAGGYFGGGGGQAGTGGVFFGASGPGGGGGGGSSYANPTLVTNATATVGYGIFSPSAKIRWVDISTTSLATLVVGTGTSQQLAATFPDPSSAVSWQVTSGALPAGLSLSTAGVLAGTPSTAGPYAFTVTATAQPNAVAASTYTYTGTVTAVPAAPTSVQGTPGYESVALSWTAPSSTGFAAIVGYAIRSSTDGGRSWSVVTPNTGSSATTSTVDGLSSLLGYQFQVAAINTTGTGAWSAASAVVAPSGVRAILNQGGLAITVNGGSTAFFRRQGTVIQVADSSAFSLPQQFTATAVSSVTVDGMAAGAGFVFTAGLVDAALQTSSIDAVTFDPTAGFTGTVQVSLPTRTLVVTGGLRGLGGVTIDAPAVQLAGDAEIDGGGEDVTITGAVDGRTRGGQALTVTALGSIVFQRLVGGTTPLKSLETRATRPLQLSTNRDLSRAIPLHYLPYTQPGGGIEDKYGIEVAIGDNQAMMYEFDTGGPGFWAGYNPAWWRGVTPAADAEHVQATYTSKNFYQGLVTPAVLTIGGGGETVSTVKPVELAAITAGGNSRTEETFDFSNAKAPPIEGHFFGDFGASFALYPQGTVIVPAVQMTNPLFQLPGNLSSGFVVQLGPIGRSPRLVVGLTDGLRDQFPIVVPLSKIDGVLYPNPNGAAVRRQAYETFAFAGNYTLSRDGTTVNLGTLPTLIDSGAPSTTIHYPDDPPQIPFVDDKTVRSGAVFSGTYSTAFPGLPFEWNFTVGSEGSVDAVGFTAAASAASSSNTVNTGLNLYNGYDVMFDVERGFLRLRPSGGLSSVQVGAVTTLGPQRYGQNATLAGSYSTGGGDFSVGGSATLAAAVNVAAGSGSVTFSGSVDSAVGEEQSLAVQSNAATRFVRPVGSTRPLASLVTDAGGSMAAVTVTTTGVQTFGDASVELDGIYTTSNAAFSVGGNATLAGAVTVQTTGPDGTRSGDSVRFAGGIDSVKDAAWPLSLQAGSGTVTVAGRVGGSRPLGGIRVGSAATATFSQAVQLDGSGFGAAGNGLEVGDRVTVSLAAGGSIRKFSGSGVVFDKESKGSLLTNVEISGNVSAGIQLSANTAGGIVDYTGTVVRSNTIFGNGGFGIEVAGPVRGITIIGNTIGRAGTTNPWGLVSEGPNTHGIVLAPGSYPDSAITQNLIQFNRRSGIMLPGAVQGLAIDGNTIENNKAHGVEVATGDFTGTSITANVIRLNDGDGISLGAGIGQAVAGGGDPFGGYSAAVGHYVVSYANAPNFYDPTTPPEDPQIALQVGTKRLAVNMDTGSRGLYFDALQLDRNLTLDGPRGYVYLNSSNRLFFGQWSTQSITFLDSSYVDSDGPRPDRKAVASVPILVVKAVGASTTPAPGATTASTTFGTTIATGQIVITDGTVRRTVGVVPNASGTGPAGTVTIPGGWWANYDDNMLSDTTSKLAPVANFGIGFDRSGQGTQPTDDRRNQAYNAFLNLAEMRSGQMRPGYVISATGVQLGLDGSVADYAYTDLVPTGLPQGSQSAPDWQPATGTLDYRDTTSGTGQIVIDMGIPSGILTLPGEKPTTRFDGKMTVNLLNSGGTVRYTIDESQTDNLLNPTAVAFFDPLAGNYTENMPPQSRQFFNTGRRLFAAFDYLYDAAGGFLGLKVGNTRQAQDAFSGNGRFTAGLNANPNAPTGVTNLQIGGTTALLGNTISANRGNGVTVNGAGSVGNAIQSNSIFANGLLGIDLSNGGNASQVAPVLDPTIRLVGEKTITVTGSLAATTGYSGTYQLQFFASPYADGQSAASIEGRRYLGTVTVSAGPFSASLPRGISGLGDWITATVTPTTGDPNTSEFSIAARVMTLVVDTASDAGTGSLRSAMTLANANPGGEVVEFAIPPSSSPATISLRSALPVITGPIVIDGRTQPITLNGAQIAAAANGLTAAASAAVVAIRSLTITGFPRGAGIWSAAANAVFDGNTLTRNYNGIALAGGPGTVVAGNTITASGNWGVYATGGLDGARIENNAITNTVLVGIYLQNATGVTVGRAGRGNVITGGTARGLYSTGIYVTGISSGTRVQANTASGNGSGVMLVAARGVLVGGVADADRNTIVDNRGYGLFATGNSAGSVVQRNVISGNGRNVVTAKAFALAYQG